MQSLLDYLGSMILGGALIGIIMSANDMASENQSVYNGDMLVQEMLVQTAHMLEGEFRNMGMGVPENERSVLAADTSSITFLYDMDRNGVADTLRYYAGTPSEFPGTQNELDKPLYRKVNDGSADKISAITVFRLRYLTRVGEVLPTPVPATRLSEIHAVELTLEVQNPYAIHRSASMTPTGQRDALWSSSLWQQTRLASQNSRR